MDGDQHTKKEAIADKYKLLLNLNSDKINRIESGLEKNWIAHLILSGVGVALVFNIGNLPGFITHYFSESPYDRKAVAAITLAILLYYFMKLGHLLTSFVDASQLQDSLLKDYLDGDFDEGRLSPLHKSTNFFVETFFSPGVLTSLPYLVVTLFVVSIAQAGALFLFAQAYGLQGWLPLVFQSFAMVFVVLYIVFEKLRKYRLRKAFVLGSSAAVAAWCVIALRRGSGIPTLVLTGCAVVTVSLYVLFWGSQKNHPNSTRVVVTAAALVVLLLALFAGTAPA